MKYQVIAGAVILAAVAGWASAQTGRPQQTQPPSAMVSIDQVGVLSTRVQQLQDRVQALEARLQQVETANQSQGSTILQLVAYRQTATASQNALQQRFDAHTHNYSYPNLGYTNVRFVTESHVTEADDTDYGSYISVWTESPRSTSGPN
jgi:hypothetical protein